MDKRSNVKEYLEEICDDNGHLSTQETLEEIKNYLLGEDWYTSLGISQEEVNPYILMAIIQQYPGYKQRLRNKVIRLKIFWSIIAIIANLVLITVILLICRRYMTPQLYRAISCPISVLIGTIMGKTLYKYHDFLETKLKIKRAVHMAFDNRDDVKVEKISIKKVYGDKHER